MDIVSSCDDNFAPYFCAMLHSASLYHPEAHYWLLGHGISAENRRKLEDFAASLDLRLTILSDFEAQLAGAHVRDRFTPVTYARVLIPRLLPQTLDRVLYLDADTTVTASLHELYNSDLKGMPLAAVEEVPRGAEIDRAELGLPPDTPYFNSGVMVLDLALWRRENLAEQVMDFVHSYPGELKLFDQSALNAVLAGRFMMAPRRWNFSDFDRWETVGEVAVIHYIRRLKPWLDPRSPFTELFRLHLSRTPFPVIPPPLRPLKHLRRLLGARLGVEHHRIYADAFRRDFDIHDAIATPALAEATRLIDARDRKLGPLDRPA